MTLRTIRWFLWLAVVVVAGMALAVVLSPEIRDRVVGAGGEGQGVADIGGPFSLVDHTGEPVTQEDFLGRPTVYFFGFTHCPDVCPTTLYELTAWLEALGDDADPLRVVFVTVDPERDTPEDVGRYLQAFDERIVGLSGEPDDVAAMAEEWRVYVDKVPLEDEDGYTVDHTASIYLMDGEGEFFGTIAYGEDRDLAIGKLRRLAEEG